MMNVIAVAVAVLGISAGATGLAAAGPDDATTSSAAATSTTVASEQARPPGRPGARGPAARAVHGDLIVRTQDGFEEVTFDRGTLTAAHEDSVTVHRPDDVDVTVELGPDTKYVGAENAAALEEGKPVTVVHQDGTAKAVIQRDPEHRPHRPGARRGPPAPSGRSFEEPGEPALGA